MRLRVQIGNVGSEDGGKREFVPGGRDQEMKERGPENQAAVCWDVQHGGAE